jgi:hypothetical protein
MGACRATAPRGTRVRLEASSAHSGHIGWSADCAGTLCDVVVGAETRIDVTFTPSYVVRVVGEGFPDSGTMMVDGTPVHLPWEESMPAGTRRVLQAAFTPGFTFLAFDGLPCRETWWSSTCTLDVALDLEGRVRVKRLMDWLWPVDTGVLRMAPLTDGGVLLLGAFEGSADIVGHTIFGSSSLSYLLMELSGPQQVGRWSVSGGEFELEDPIFLRTDGGYALGSTVRDPNGFNAYSMQWGSVDAGRVSSSWDYMLLGLDQHAWEPRAAAFASPGSSQGNFVSFQTDVLEREGSLFVPVKTPGEFPAWFDGGTRSGLMLLETDFASGGFRGAALGPAVSENGLSSASPLVFMYLGPTLLPFHVTGPGCPAWPSGYAAIAEYYPGHGCGRAVMIDAGVPLSTGPLYVFQVIGRGAFLAYSDGSDAERRMGIARYDTTTLAKTWETSFSLPDFSFRTSPFDLSLFSWGDDVLIVWRTPPTQRIVTIDGVELACVRAPNSQAISGSDLRFAIFDGATGRLVWNDCLANVPPGATDGARGFGGSSVVPLGSGIVIGEGAGTGGVGTVVFGDKSYQPALRRRVVLYLVTPPRF